MTDKPEPARFSDAQLALAGIGAAIVLIVIVIALALWNATAG